MTAALYNLVTALLMALMLKSGADLLDGQALRSRGVPPVAVALTALAVAGIVLQLSWPGATDALDDDPARPGWWRGLTSVFLQNGGVVGDAFNLVTLAAVVALASWFWGGRWTLVLFVCGAVVPSHLSGLLFATSPSTDPRNFVGSSGATYFLAATLAAALLLTARDRRERLLALAVPVLGVATFVAQGNAHGLVTVYGFVLGLLLGLAVRRTREAPGLAAPRRPRGRGDDLRAEFISG